MQKPADSKPGLRKPAVETRPPVPVRAEAHDIRSTSELCFPVFDLYGGPVAEPPKK